MLMLKALISFIFRIMHLIKRLIAIFILRSVLGWSVDKSYNDYESLRKGKHIVTYAITGDYEIIMGCLLAHAYDIPIIIIAKDELGKIPIISRVFGFLSDMVFVDRKSHMNTTEFIANDLKSRKNYALLIAPEGTRSRVDDLKSGFYNIALETCSDIYHMAIDFENHTIGIVLVTNDAVVQTSSYEKIKGMVEEKFMKDKPFQPERCHLIDLSKTKKTSLVNINKSLVIYIPPLIVVVIFFGSIIHTLFY
jgi:1-acyl-sn-glycerol-3-phosphate acyltransferase